MAIFVTKQHHGGIGADDSVANGVTTLAIADLTNRGLTQCST
jgi:hypothetical protein